MGSTEPSKLRIAICGGGIAGAALFNALSNYPHLDAHVFESAAEFRDNGNAIGLTQNARSALSLIGPSAVACFERAGAVPQAGAELLLAQGPDTGKSVGCMGREGCVVSSVHRPKFVRELLEAAKADQRMHASKKLVAIEQKSEAGPVVLQFADGTQHECDVLVGADGIHSRVRKYVLGEADPAASPVPAGYWFAVVMKPYDEAAALLGTAHLDKNKPREVAWVGDGALIFHNMINDGQLVQLALAVACGTDDPPTDWCKVISSEEIAGIYANWPENLRRSVEELVCKDTPTHNALYAWEHLPGRTYIRSNVAIIGDAAHSTTPWQGSGAGMSIEDALVLSSLLGHAKDPSDAKIALEIYDTARRQRTQQIVESSKITGQMVTNRHPDVGLEAENLKEKLSCRWDFILDFDIAKHQAEALKDMEMKIGQVKG